MPARPDRLSRAGYGPRRPSRQLWRGTATDRETLLNWAGDPWGSTIDWLASRPPVFGRPAQVEVPDVRGMFTVQARHVLARAGLRVKVVELAGQDALAKHRDRSEPGPGSEHRASRGRGAGGQPVRQPVPHGQDRPTESPGRGLRSSASTAAASVRDG
jgi:hypothetical protein